MNNRQAIPLPRVAAALALAVASQFAAAQAAPTVIVGHAHARGLSVLGADVAHSDDGYAVSTRVSRSVMSGVLAPVTLKVVLRDGDGVVKAEQMRALGPAEMPRRRTRSFRFDTRFDVAPAADDTVEISLGG